MANSKDINQGKKPALSLLPPSGVIQVAKVMEDGAVKRSPYNWRDGKVSAMGLIDKILRHAFLLIDRHDLTEDSKLSNMAAIAANALVYLDAEANGNLDDDRPKVGNAQIVMEKHSKQEPIKRLGEDAQIFWPKNPLKDQQMSQLDEESDGPEAL